MNTEQFKEFSKLIKRIYQINPFNPCTKREGKK